MIAAEQQSNNVKTRINTLKHRSSRPKNKRLASNEFFDASQLKVSIDGQNFAMWQFQKCLIMNYRAVVPVMLMQKLP